MDRLEKYRRYETLSQPPAMSGRLTRIVGLTLEARGLNVPVGTTCQLSTSTCQSASPPMMAEVVGFNQDCTYLMTLNHLKGLRPGDAVVPVADRSTQLSNHLLGRVLNALCLPLDDKPPLVLAGADTHATETTASARASERVINTTNPLKRDPISEVLDVGVRAINGLMTIGKGQRVGLFAGSGVGKSVLLGMITRATKADVVVVGLIGERGREVREFIENTLGEEGLKKSVVVASPADDAPLLRLKAAELATRIAEHFAQQGKSVLLLMDSLTRFAQAQREIALAVGEPPATKGYPPSVFSKIPQLVERAGNGHKEGGAITAIYTVLTEGDDLQDPVADAARAILDGHIVLSRNLAEEGIYPAIDVEASLSRVMYQIVDANHWKAVLKIKKYLNLYRENKDLVTLGAYKPGNNAELDEALAYLPRIRDYISQDMCQGCAHSMSVKQLHSLLT